MNIEEMVEVFPEEGNDNGQDENGGEEYTNTSSNNADETGGPSSEGNASENDGDGDEQVPEETEDEKGGTFRDGSDNSAPEEKDDSEGSNEEESREKIDSDNASEKSETGSVKRTLVFSFLAIFVALALVFGYFVFFNKSVVGTWKIDKSGENKGVAALIFDSDGKATYTTGSYAATGNWSKDGENLNLKIVTDEGDIFSGRYTCRVSTGLVDKTVELTNEKKERINLKQYKMEDAVHPVSNFVPKAELLGKWGTGREGGYTYEFKDNGLAVLNKGNVTITFTYYFDDESITFMQYYLKDSADESPRTRVRYALNHEILRIGNMSLKKV